MNNEYNEYYGTPITDTAIINTLKQFYTVESLGALELNTKTNNIELISLNSDIAIDEVTLYIDFDKCLGLHSTTVESGEGDNVTYEDVYVSIHDVDEYFTENEIAREVIERINEGVFATPEGNVEFATENGLI